MPDQATERWRPVVGYEGLYEVSDQGQVRSLAWGPGRHTGWSLGWTDPRGYRRVKLHWNGSRHHAFVHVLVLEAFVGPRPPGYHADHGNTVKHDNRVVNLEWVPPAVNAARAEAAGLIPHHRGVRHHAAVLAPAQVQDVRRLSAAGLSQHAIARRFGVSRGCISNILRGLSWKHLPRL